MFRRKRQPLYPDAPPDTLDFTTSGYWVSYGAKHNDGTFTVYTTDTAMANDPLFVRGGGHSVARGMVGPMVMGAPATPTGPWRRVFVRDIKALRGED